MTLNAMIVDDEPLARLRLRTLLGDCADPATHVVAEAADAVGAMGLLARHPCDVVLLDIHMPGMDGLGLAQALRQLPQPPAVVFVTAHAGHALQAFDLEATDYLTKPVRLERLQAALKKVERAVLAQRPTDGHALHPAQPQAGPHFIHIQERGRTERVPLADVMYLKAELKYLTVRTRQRTLIGDGSLSEFEERHGAHWLRIHRNALVARHAIRALVRQPVPQGQEDRGDRGEVWAVRLDGVSEHLAVSRRQLASVKEVLGGR